MRTYLPGIEEDIKRFILEQFSSEGERHSIGDIFVRVTADYDITSGRFFKIISDLEKLRYIKHDTEEKADCNVSMLQRI